MDNINFKYPEVYLIGYTCLNLDGLTNYLKSTNQLEFLNYIDDAKKDGVNDGEVLCSFYAKACYSSLVVGRNKNINNIRDIKDNIQGIIKSSHGSVLEHVSLNFMITNCSRVFTHELVRHRVGTAFSQTSGRYVRTNKLNVVIDPILEPANDLVEECRDYIEKWYKRLEEKLKVSEIKDFSTKKKITSAMRRMLPNGQCNEIGLTLNLRALRHTIEMRTSRHAEWEIRNVFNQIYDIVSEKYKLMFFDAKKEYVDGLFEMTFENKKI